MRIRVEQIAKGQEEEIILRCYEVSDDLHLRKTILETPFGTMSGGCREKI